MSFGPRFSARRQRAMSSSSAVESGPPETARTRAGAWTSGANSAFASAAETGAASSAADTLLFSLDPLLHRRRRAWELAQHFAERCAGRFLLAERGERLPKAQKRIGSFGDGFIFGRDGEEGFRGVAVALALEHAFAQPIGGIPDEPIVGIFAQEAAEGVFGEGASVASAPLPAGPLRGGCPGTAPFGGPMLARSSGAPAARPAGAPIGGSAASALMFGAALVLGAAPDPLIEPSVCGAPGAFGFWRGSNASPRLPGVAAGGEFCGCDCTAGRGAPSSCKRRTWPSSCWLRNCSCSIAPVSCRIWASRRSRRKTRSGPESCAV